MGVAAFIPAKMTSRRLRGKNLRELGGRPLIYYSIQAARLAPSITVIQVSSEHAALLKVAQGYGAMPIARPPELSGDHVPNVEVLKHFYGNDADRPELVVLLQPTHPLRNPDDLEKAIRLMQTSDADSLFSVTKTDCLLGVIENGLYAPEFPVPRNKAKEPARYRNTGSFYIFRPERSFLTDEPFGRKIIPYVLEHPEFEIDIDHEFDLRLAECILQTHRQNFAHFGI